VPYVMNYSGAHGTDAYQPASVVLDYAKLAALLGIAGAAGGLLALVRAPNPFMLGPLFAVIALTVNEVQLSSMPGWLANAGQLLLGCALGARFERQSLETAPRYVLAVLFSIAGAIVIAALCGVALAWASGLSVPSLILATAPGGIAEMCLTARALQLGVPLVTAAHVTRVIVLVTTTGAIFRLARAVAARARG